MQWNSTEVTSDVTSQVYPPWESTAGRGYTRPVQAPMAAFPPPYE